ncbi:MAG: hypothetical protein LC635_05725 [Pseudonocardiaceae bacterium]|nr:hypothetical protein [Pseudonocardiaceae bacterium]
MMQHDYTGILSMAPLLTDVDGDDDLEILSSGFWDNFGVYDLDSGGVWTARGAVRNDPASEVAAYQYGALVSCPDGPRYVFTGQSSSHLRAVDPRNVRNVLDAYLAGGVAYGSAAEVPTTTAPAFLGNVNAVASLGGDGQPRLLVGSTDGYLYALRACATSAADLIAWQLDFEAAVGEPIPADIDGDGAAEIIVAAADGYLYAIDDAAMAIPARIGEVARAGNLDVAELDELDANAGIVVEWKAVAGATGYEVAIFDGVGAPMTSPPFVAVGATTSVALRNVVLEPELPYYTVVRAVAADGSRSFERMSDGFRIRAGATDATADDGGGCQTSSGRTGAVVALALVALVRRRRR